nr:hypothetical protein [Halomonas sp.]
MLKGLFVCFAVLFAQLAVLHLIDTRLYNGSQDIRNAAVTTTTTKHEDEVEEVQG